MSKIPLLVYFKGEKKSPFTRSIFGTRWTKGAVSILQQVDDVSVVFIFFCHFLSLPQKVTKKVYANSMAPNELAGLACKAVTG